MAFKSANPNYRKVLDLIEGEGGITELFKQMNDVLFEMEKFSGAGLYRRINKVTIKAAKEIKSLIKKHQAAVLTACNSKVTSRKYKVAMAYLKKQSMEARVK